MDAEGGRRELTLSAIDMDESYSAFDSKNCRHLAFPPIFILVICSSFHLSYDTV
jgi:hypothetical protein